MAGEIDSGIARAARAIADGAPGSALAQLAALIERHPADPRLHAEAARALLACAERPGGLDGVAPDTLAPLVRRLVLQPDCPARPLILHHEVASRLTSKSPAGVPALIAAIEPTLRAMLGDGPPAPALLILLLLARDSLGRWMPPPRLTAWHRDAFPDFAEPDLALPYSAMFQAGAFARNRDDLVGALEAGGPAFLDRLRPRHLPLLAWARGGRSPFAGDDAFGRWLARAATAPPDDADRRAARALVLAFGLPGGLDEPSCAALGLDEATRAEAGLHARARGALPRGGGEAAAQKLGQRRWQALAAVRNLVAGRVPFRVRGRRRVRVAVCVSGQLRGFRRVLPAWRRSVFAGADVRFFVHGWTAIGRGPALPWREVLPFSGARFTDAYRRLGMQEGMEAFEARYPTLFADLGSSGTVTADELRAAYGTDAAVVEDDRDPRFAGFSNPQKMHYKIWAAHRLALASGEPFDLVVRVRPDLAMRFAAFDWRDLRDACAGASRLYADAAFGIHHGVPMIGDQLAIAAPAVMARYAATWEEYPRVAALDLAGAPRDFTGHVSLAQTCWLNGIAVGRAPVKLDGLREPEPFGSAAILRALEADAAGRMDAIDRALIEAARADRAR